MPHDDAPRILPAFAEARRQAIEAQDADGKRTLSCGRCGAGFGCSPVGPCWCGQEAFKLPVPLPGKYAAFGDCLCPKCLREIAAELKDAGPVAAATPEVPPATAAHR